MLDQQQCWYTAARRRRARRPAASQVRNSDPLLHNVRAASEVNQPFNQGQPVQGMRYAHTFSTEEVMVPIKCDVHAWMNAWVGVVSHPYFAVTGADGAFSLPNLPAGAYTVEAWHEAAGTATGTVTVTAAGHGVADAHSSRCPRHERHADAHAPATTPRGAVPPRPCGRRRRGPTTSR